MNTPDRDITSTISTNRNTDDLTATRVGRELAVLRDAAHGLMATRPTSNAGHADRAARLALVYARRTGWWRVLTAAGIQQHTVHPVFWHAVIVAESHDRDRARFWRDTAADWRARAGHRPTSDAAGALSNWHELGVTT